jgi:chitinase
VVDVLRFRLVRRRFTASLTAAATVASLVVVVPVAVLTLTSPAAAVVCSFPAWAEGQTYTVGTRVTYSNRGYEALQTHTAHPGTNWNPASTPSLWKDLGACDGTPTPTTPPPTSGPPPTSPPPGGGGNCAPPWVSTQVYTGGNEVSYNGRNWRARWWTQGQAPGTNEVWTDLGSCTGGPSPTTPPPTSPPPTTPPPGPPGTSLLGYFVQWGVYQRNYHVKNIVTSGSASKLNYINYAFGNVQGGGCTLGDTYADYDRFYTAGESVDGVADTWDAGALRGNFGQLRRLKRMHPNIKILFSFGGWTWSGGFTQAAANPTAFANSCYNLVEDPRWADVFDGIDIDWEYPNACGLTCDSSGPLAFRNLVSALRSRFGSSYLVTAAITADATSGGKIDATDYASAAQHVNWYNVMTYDFFGAWAPQGPTAPHSPLQAIPGNAQSQAGFNTAAALNKLRSKGVPSNKLLIGIGFYGRGWSGVTQAAPGGSATGPAPGTYEQGVDDYKVVKNRCPATSTVAGTAYGLCGGQWWSYDTPNTISGKMGYARSNGLGGAFFWELSGDTTNGELITAMRNGL